MVAEAVFSFIVATPGTTIRVAFRGVNSRNGNAIGNAAFVLVSNRLPATGNFIDHYHNYVGQEQ
jgi:hypothetical protein